MDSHAEFPSRSQTAGTLALFGGIGIWALIAIDSAIELPIEMPRTWYLHRPLWGVVGGILFALGWKLQRASPRVDGSTWRPQPEGRRFHRLIVYSRDACHLCDDAKAVLARYLEYLPEIETIDIDTHPELEKRFGTLIPVVEIDGQVRFKGRVDELLLRRLIEGTPPHVIEDADAGEH